MNYQFWSFFFIALLVIAIRRYLFLVFPFVVIAFKFPPFFFIRTLVVSPLTACSLLGFVFDKQISALYTGRNILLSIPHWFGLGTVQSRTLQTTMLTLEK